MNKIYKKLFLVTCLIMVSNNYYSQKDSTYDANSDLNFYNQHLADKLIMPYVTLVDMDGDNFFEKNGRFIFGELNKYNGIILNDEVLSVNKFNNDTLLKSMDFYSSPILKIKYIKEYVSKYFNAKNTLAKLSGRKKDGSFNIEELNILAKEIMDSKKIKSNEAFYYDRTADEVGVMVLLNTYFLIKMNNQLVIFRSNINREELNILASKYWFEKDKEKSGFKESYDSLFVPVEYIDYVPTLNFSNDQYKKKPHSTSMLIVNTLIKSNIWFKDLTRNIGDFEFSQSNKNSQITVDELLKDVYSSINVRGKMKNKTSYFYLTDIIETKDGKLKNKIVGKLLIKPQSKIARQVGGRKIHSNMKIIEGHESFNVSIGYNPYYDVTSNGFNVEIGIPIRRSRSDFTSLEYTMGVSISGSKFIDGGILKFEGYKNYIENSKGEKEPDPSSYEKITISGYRTYNFTSFTLGGIAFKLYPFTKGNIFLKYNLSGGIFWNNIFRKLYYEGGVGAFLRNSISIHHYVNHRINVFSKFNITNRTSMSKNYLPRESTPTNKTDGWNNEFNNIEGKTTPSILFGISFDL